MDAYGSPLHVASTVPEPYVHLDNRSLVLHDGRHCVMYANSAFPWVAETIRVLLDELRTDWTGRGVELAALANAAAETFAVCAANGFLASGVDLEQN